MCAVSCLASVSSHSPESFMVAGTSSVLIYFVSWNQINSGTKKTDPSVKYLKFKSGESEFDSQQWDVESSGLMLGRQRQKGP